MHWPLINHALAFVDRADTERILVLIAINIIIKIMQ